MGLNAFLDFITIGCTLVRIKGEHRPLAESLFPLKAGFDKRISEDSK